MTQKNSSSIPRHVAIIMDGNGRWARQRGLRRIEGHRQGAESVKAVLRACQKAGVKYLTLYAFSTENWVRPKTEIAGLMKLLAQFLRENEPELRRKRIRLRAIGRLQDLPRFVRTILEHVIKTTADYDQGNLILALSYGGRDEIAYAARSIAQQALEGKIAVAEIDEAAVARHLYAPDVPDPANTPGARVDAVSWTDDYGALWLFGGSFGGSMWLNDVWKLVSPPCIAVLGTNGVSSDFDGDGKTDMLLTDASGRWYFRLSGGSYASSTVTALPFGGAGYRSLSGDFDGDGLSDMAAYETAGVCWYFRLSSRGYWTLTAFDIKFGGVGYAPVAGKFDADGLSDLIVMEEATGYWFFRLSTSSYGTLILFALPFGGSGYQPLAGDFDGDGLDDMVVYERATGYWFFRLSSAYYGTLTVFELPFGGSGYVGLAGDYDADGLADMVVYEEATGCWFFRLSSGYYGTLIVFALPFGSGYLPVP